MSLLIETDLFCVADVNDRFCDNDMSPLNSERLVTKRFRFMDKSNATYALLLNETSADVNKRPLIDTSPIVDVSPLKMV
jgi:hypothetical protein